MASLNHLTKPFQPGWQGLLDNLRRRVRPTTDACQPGGGFRLGTGNTVANYIPLDNYLVMLDEGRGYG